MSADFLSLHHLTALDADAPALVDLAKAADCRYVCLFTHVPEAARAIFPFVATREDVAAVSARLRATGVRVHNIEYFPIAADVRVDAYADALQRGAELGAARATVHINHEDRAIALDQFRQLCQLAAENGLRIGLEFTAFAKIRTLSEAIRFLDDAASTNADIALDSLHHFRAGGTVSDLCGPARGRVGYAQISDGPQTLAPAQQFHEAIYERQRPGDGALPLSQLFATLPPGIVVDVEVPQQSLQREGVSPLDRVRRAVTAARAALHAMAKENDSCQ